MIVPSVALLKFTSPRSFPPVSRIHLNPFFLLRLGLPEGLVSLVAGAMTLGTGPASQRDCNHLRIDICSRTMPRTHFSPVQNLRREEAMQEDRPEKRERRESGRWTNAQRATIVVVDDHVVVRRGLRALLEEESKWNVIAEAGDGREAIEKARVFHPDLMILDITMPQLNGLEAIPGIRKASPSTHILVLSMHDEEELIHRTLEAGASGYVLKSDAGPSLLKAAYAVLSGRRFVSPSVTPVVLNRSHESESQNKERSQEFVSLTRREKEVIQLLAEGKSNKQVATTLSISVRTAENHRARLMKKLGVDSLSALVRYAVRNRIIQP